jgi:hypothetical protein
MKHLLLKSLLCGIILFGNLFAFTSIRQNDKDVPIEKLSQKHQEDVKRIKESFGDSVSIDINDKITLFRQIRIHPNNTGNKIGSLNDKIQFVKTQNVKENDTLLVNRAVAEINNFFQKVFVETGYPEKSLYAMRHRKISNEDWLYYLKNIIDKKRVDIRFQEYYNGIKICGHTSYISFYNGDLVGVDIYSHATPYVKISASKPKVPINHAIQNYLKKKHLPLTTTVQPMSWSESIHTDKYNIINPVDSFPIQDLIYLPRQGDSLLVLCWRFFVNFRTVCIDALTGDVIVDADNVLH